MRFCRHCKAVMLMLSGVDVGDRPMEALGGQHFDRIFIVVHGRGGEDGMLQGLLDALKIPYTGSGILGSALAMDKLKTKLCWSGAGIPTPPWWVVKDEVDIGRCIRETGISRYRKTGAGRQ